MLTAPLIVAYQRARKELLAEHPDMEGDPALLADTLEGITDAPTVIASFIRKAREDEANVDALSVMMKDMGARKSRLQARADKLRAAALSLLDAIGLRKLEQPDFSCSVVPASPAVMITDEALLPEEMIRVRREPNRAAIRDALRSGSVVPGAELSNGPPMLRILTA